MSKLGKSKLMKQFLIFGTLLASIPVVVFSAYMYRHTSTTVQENVNMVHTELITAARDAIEQTLRTADQQLYYVSVLTSTIEALNLSTYKYNYTTFENIQLLKNRMIETQGLVSQRTGVEAEYTLINTKGQWLQNTDGFYQLDVAKIQPLVHIADLALEPDSLLITQAGTPIYLEESNVFLARPFNRGQTNYGVAMLSFPNKQLFKRLSHVPDKGVMMIVDHSGQIVACYQDGDVIGKPDLLAQKLPGEAGTVNLRVEDRVYSATVIASGYMPWRYVVAIDIRDITGQSELLAAAFITVTLSIISVILFAFFIFTKRIYRPVEKLIGSIRVEGQGLESGNDEFQTISHYIDNMKDANTLLQQVQEDRKKQLARQFLLQLMEGNISHEWAERRAETLAFEMNKKYYVLLGFEAQQTLGTDEELAESGVRLVLIRDIAEELYKEKTVHLMEIIGKRFWVFMETETLNAARADGLKLMQVVAASLKIQVRCCLCEPFEPLLILPDRFEEAVYALRNRIGFDDDNIALSVQGAVHKRAYSRPLHKELMKAISQADLQAAREGLTRYLAYLNGLKLPVERRQFEVVCLATDVVSRLNMAVYPALTPLFEQGIDQGDWIYNLLILPALETRKETEVKSISEMVAQIIEKECQSPLTLEYCADRIGYNPSHVSRMFKQQMGVSFKEYLYLFRIEESKRMLKTTELTVTEISNLLCYNNAQNFIRVFKKVEGITPGAYRASFGGSANEE